MFLRITIAVSIAVLISSAWNAGLRLDMRDHSNHALWIVFWTTSIGTLVYYFRRPWPRNLYPLLTCAATLLCVYALPFDTLSLHLEFHANQATREAIVADIQAGRIRPIDPPKGILIWAPHRTIGKHEIALIDIDGKSTAFFYTWHSSDSWEGWLYVPPGANPDHFPVKTNHKRQRFDEHWIYFSY